MILNWGEKSKINFLKELQSAIDKIAMFPESSPKINEFGGVYKCVVTKQTSFVYQITGSEIEVLTLSDNRQNPIELLKELKNFR